MPGELDHLRWKRLEIESLLKPRNPPPSPRPRSDRDQHVQELDSESATVVKTLRESRLRQGIDPNRLLVLRMQFLDATRRDLLAKLGLNILDDRDLSASCKRLRGEFLRLCIGLPPTCLSTKVYAPRTRAGEFPDPPEPHGIPRFRWPWRLPPECKDSGRCVEPASGIRKEAPVAA